MQESSRNWLSSFQGGDLGELGWEMFVDKWKFWADGWSVGIVYFGSMRNSGDSSSQNYKLKRRDYWRAL